MLTRRLVFAAALAQVLTGTAQADANSLNDYLGPRDISTGEVGRADSRASSSTTLNPAGLALATQVVFEGSYGYRPEDKATIISVSACDSTVAVPGCFYYRFFEANLELGESIFDRSAHEFGGNMSRALTDSIFVGLNFKYYDYDSELVDEGGDTRGFTLDAGAIVRPTNILQVGVVGYNLIPQDTPQYPTAIGGGISVRPTPALGIGADGLWD
ncbi:MAG: hypothetical protein KJO07_20225, partial [Deltaproteobacteria bacterium]|nr:hypothetical protein [Deltaproteobacteria bacterium]